MATADTQKETLRIEWLNRLSALVDLVQGWVEELGWSTRRIEKPMEDSQPGTHKAPALLFQREFTRMLLEPIAPSAPGTEGVVDLYVMPAYDDIATLYFYDGEWQLHHLSPRTSAAAAIREAQAKTLTRETFREVLEELTK